MSGKVSIIVPIYNLEEHLGACVESLVGQTYSNIEILLIDDGSTDNSLGIARKYENKYADRIKTFHQANKGVASARNFGINKSIGEYITFVDGDDLIKEDTIEELMKLFILDANVGVVACQNLAFSNQVVFQETGLGGVGSSVEMMSGVNAARDMMYQRKILNSPHGKIFKRSILGRNLLFPVGYPIGEDLYFNFKVLTSGVGVGVSDGIFYGYRVREGSAMRSDFKPDRLKLFDLFSEMRSSAERENNNDLMRAVDNRIFAEAIYVGIQVVGLRGQYIAKRRCEDIVTSLRARVLFDRDSRMAYRFYAAFSYVSPSLMLRLVGGRVRLGYELRRALA